MSVRGLNWQAWTLRLVAGLNQKADARALESPELAILKDGQFDEVGGIQTRYPFAAAESNIFGGTTITDARSIEQNGSERLLFTKDALYSWNAQLSKWVSRGTHLAVKVTEEPRFFTTGDQVSCERAELSGTIVYAWADGTGTYIAALDKTTGSVITGPTFYGSTSRPRLIALSTKILFFTRGDSGAAANLNVRAIDPADPATGIASAVTAVLTVAGGFDTYYDATRILGTDTVVVVARRTPNTSYEIAKVTQALAVTQSTKARVCDGPIAVSSTPDGASAQVIRADTTNILGDLITISTLADVFTAQAVGTANATPVRQIAAAHRSVQNGGQYRCYAFWDDNEYTDSTTWLSESNWVDTGGTLGTEAVFVRRLGIASRAFDHDGRVYFWGAFAGESGFSGAGADGFRAQLQNSYFLYRDDGTLVSKAAFHRAAGFSAVISHLPGVQLVSGTTGYAWCGGDRRIIDLGGASHSGYSDRGPLDISFTFDSNEARRCVRLGKTLYISGGEVLQYDGAQLTEVGFHVYPWHFAAADVDVGGGDAIANGTYTLKYTWRWNNAQGEQDRSTTATHGNVTVAGGPDTIQSAVVPLYITHKTSRPVAVEGWRTTVSPPDGAPMYLFTSKDPAATGNNRYVENNFGSDLLTPIDDNFADATLSTKEASPENGAVLENLAPPGATIIAATDTRIFLAGVAGDPDRVWYSKQRGEGEIAAFHDALTVAIPAPGGDITGLVFIDRTPFVFRETAVYRLDGEGLDNLGGGFNFEARRLPGDIGAVNQESIAVTEKGIVFKSSKGWHLTNGAAVEYIGAAVADYDSETVLATNVMETQHQVRVLTGSRMLVLDTNVGQWAEWTISSGLHATVWGGAHAYLTSTGPRTQLTTYTNVDYGIDLETAFVKLNDLQGYGAVDYFDLLGEYRSACTIRVRLARDYWKDGADTYFQDKTHTPSLTAGMPLELRHRPSIKQVKALKVRITVTPGAIGLGESVKLTGLAFLLGVQPGLNRNLLTAAKQ